MYPCVDFEVQWTWLFTLWFCHLLADNWYKLLHFCKLYFSNFKNEDNSNPGYRPVERIKWKHVRKLIRVRFIVSTCIRYFLSFNLYLNNKGDKTTKETSCTALTVLLWQSQEQEEWDSKIYDEDIWVDEPENLEHLQFTEFTASQKFFPPCKRRAPFPVP